MYHIQLYCITSRALPVNRELLFQMIAIEVVSSRTNIPRAKLAAIDSMKVKISNEYRPIVLGDECAVSTLPSLILHLGPSQNVRVWWQQIIFDVRATVCKGRIVESKQCSKDT